MTIHKTAGLVAVAALALPAGAAAHGGPHHQHGNSGKQPQCGKLAGFTLGGTGLDAGGFTYADGKGNGSLVLDVARANRHARAFLGLTSLPAADKTITVTNDALVLRFRGVNGLADVKPTDRVRILGRVTRSRPGCPAATPALDVRRIVVSRRPETSQASSQTTEHAKNKHGSKSKGSQASQAQGNSQASQAQGNSQASQASHASAQSHASHS